MNIHPSIFYTRLIRRLGRGGAGAYPSGHRARGLPGQVTSPSQGHIETNKTNNHTHGPTQPLYLQLLENISNTYNKLFCSTYFIVVMTEAAMCSFSSWSGSVAVAFVTECVQ